MNVDELINGAIRSLEQGEVQSAAELLTKVQSAHPSARELDHAWALLYLRIDKQREAQSALERELANFPDNNSARELLSLVTQKIEESTLTVHDIPSIGLKPFYVRPWPSSDESVFNQIFEAQNYKPLVDIVRSHGAIDSIEKVIDAGANIGCSALYFSAAFPNARILSIEPDEENFRQLEKNIKVAQVTRAGALRAAVWRSRCKLAIDHRFRDGREWARSVFESDDGTVPGYSIAELMKLQCWERIDVLKIDIEGGERTLFSDREEISSVLSKTRFIGIEIHDEFECRGEIESILTGASFDLSTHEELTVGVNRSLVRP